MIHKGEMGKQMRTQADKTQDLRKVRVNERRVQTR